MDNTGEVSECDTETCAILEERYGAGVEVQRDADAVSSTIFLAVLLASRVDMALDPVGRIAPGVLQAHSVWVCESGGIPVPDCRATEGARTRTWLERRLS